MYRVLIEAKIHGFAPNPTQRSTFRYGCTAGTLHLFNFAHFPVFLEFGSCHSG